jgi:hypothetical protein
MNSSLSGTTMRFFRHRIVVLAVAAAAISCGGDVGTTPPPPVTPSNDITQVSINPSTLGILTVGGTTTLVASARNAAGQETSASFTWSSSNPSIATVSGGVVLAVAAGATTISASVNGVGASVNVAVVVPGAPSALAALPSVYLDTQMPPAPDVGGQVISVASGGNLQGALDSANPGDVIELAAGATFSGNFILPNKNTTSTKWIVIRPSNWQSLPDTGSRLTASIAATLTLPVITSPNSAPAIQTAASAHHYRLVGIEATVSQTTSQSFGIVTLEAPSQTQLSQVPQYIVLDRMYIHGWSTFTLRRCVTLNSAWSAVVNSYLSECHEPTQDSQAIASWNGPGPFKIVNNYLEGAAENVIFGGADASIQGCVASDIEIRHNHFFKPLAWKGVWNAKNLLEIKNGQRVLVEGNIFENSWIAGQTGYAIVLKTVNQNGTAPWDVTQDVTVRYNIIRNVGAGFNIAASPDNTFPDIHARRLTINDNLIYNINIAPNDGDGRAFLVLGDLQDVSISHNTVWEPTQSALSFGGSAGFRTTYRDNVSGGGLYGFIGDDVGTGMPAIAQYAPGGIVKGNVVTLASASNYPAENFYPPTPVDVGFVDLAGLDFHLNLASLYKSKATDGRDPGADVDAVLAATAGAIVP